MSMPLRVEHVTKKFARVVAVDDVSFEAAAGELFFLLGPSGCGKTTLLRAVAGFAEIDSGEIYLGARRITNVPPHRRNTGMVFQNYALWPHMTVLENVTFGLGLRGLSRRDQKGQGSRALEIVHMQDLADRKPNQLSGGQQQRVALARALAIKPDCLLLDEPLSNLDAKLRLEMRNEIRRIHRETDLTILYVTHDQKEALSLADRVALMRRGKIVQLGSPRELYNRPASRFAAGFLGEANFVRGHLVGVGDGRSQVETPFGNFQALAPGGHVAAGQECEIVIRPELFEVLPGKVIRPLNAFRATVLEMSFLGEVEQIIFRAVGGPEEQLVQEFKVLHVPRGDAAWKPGEAVWLSFRPEAASVFPPGDADAES
jgi:iron(III) transport system ATP-binding protein